MKIALVCIAKNEDLYIDEWLEYHFKIGFSDIFIYQNDWKYRGRFLRDPRLKLIDAPGYVIQLNSYNDFLANRSAEYDWAAFFDCDEFLNLRGNYNSVSDFFECFLEFFAVGINWRIFGDSGLSYDMHSHSCLDRFIMCSKCCSDIIKTCINLRLIRSCKSMPLQVRFINPHCVNYATTHGIPNKFTIAVDMNTWCNAAHSYGYTPNNPPVQLNHYRGKTREERTLRIVRGKPDFPPWHPDYMYHDDFDEYNLNDVLDTSLVGFLRKGK